MSWRPHPARADVNPDHPKAWATDDRSGFLTNQYKMSFQQIWSGNQLVRTNILVHPDNLDIPQEQLRTLIIPIDPEPVFNARPENYVVDETDWLTTGVREDNPGNDILVTQDGELLVTQPSATEAETESTG